METKNSNFNKLIVHPNFNSTINEIKNKELALPPTSSQVNLDLQSYIFPPNGELVTNIEEIAPFDLDAKNGGKVSTEYNSIGAYDESINRFSSLEGDAYFTSHSFVLLAKDDFIPINLLTIYFYTRSKEITKGSSYIKYSLDPDIDSKKDYIRDKIDFLVQNTPEKTILFIDGPFIGGDVYTIMIGAINKFLSKEIIPIFFVKNSTSNLVTDNIPSLKNKFNSDIHWAFKFLKPGQRTNFFLYADKKNPKNAKVFCYFKGFNISPQRVEFHVTTFEKFKNMIPAIMDLIYYFMMVQGNKENQQIRPIAIAEKYARETLKLIDFNKLMQNSGIIPTINQERFAW